jgi:hypothetical protein
MRHTRSRSSQITAFPSKNETKWNMTEEEIEKWRKSTREPSIRISSHYYYYWNGK